MGEPEQMLIVWGEGGGRRCDWHALRVEQWKKVTLDKGMTGAELIQRSSGWPALLGQC